MRERIRWRQRPVKVRYMERRNVIRVVASTIGLLDKSQTEHVLIKIDVPLGITTSNGFSQAFSLFSLIYKYKYI